MASGQKKKTTTKKTAPQKSALPPIRREVSGGVCLLLALCVVVSYFQADAIVLNLLGNLLKGLAGYGYWLAAPALAPGGGEPGWPTGGVRWCCVRFAPWCCRCCWGPSCTCFCIGERPSPAWPRP